MTEFVDLEGVMPLLTSVHKALIEKNLTVATAESCTGGMISMLLTALPGSSQYFTGGIGAYSNKVKAQVLGVAEAEIKEHGAVSEQVGRAMAERARVLMGTDIGIGITGIAGPGGATEGKPVGTVWLGISSNHSTTCRNLKLNGTRDEIRQASSYEALKDLATIIEHNSGFSE